MAPGEGKLRSAQQRRRTRESDAHGIETKRARFSVLIADTQDDAGGIAAVGDTFVVIRCDVKMLIRAAAGEATRYDASTGGIPVQSKVCPIITAVRQREKERRMHEVWKSITRRN